MSKEVSTAKAAGELSLSVGEELGEVKVASDVVAVIAALAAMEADGVYSMAGNITSDIVSKFGVKNLSKGVKITMNESFMSVDVMVIVKYGYNIPAVSEAVQDKVSHQIENMTGLDVNKVNVRVAGVHFEEE